MHRFATGLVSVLLFSACGGGDSSPPATAESSASAEETEPAPDRPPEPDVEAPPAGPCETAMRIERDEGVVVENQVAEPLPWPVDGLTMDVTVTRGAGRVVAVALVRNTGATPARFDYFTGGDPRSMGPFRANLSGAPGLPPNGMPAVFPQPRREILPPGASVRYIDTVCSAPAGAATLEWSFATAGAALNGQLPLD